MESISNMDVLVSKLIDFCTTAGIKIILALVIYLVGKFIINKILSLYDKSRSFGTMDDTAKAYIRTIIKAALYIILIVSIIAQLGVQTTSIVTFIASCGVAIGLAMQGALGNIAGGLMLLIFRPFNVGDYIVASGEEGVVKKISIVYTILNTLDNKVVSIPNGALMNANIVNATAEALRRVDLDFNVAGSVPVQKVRATMMNVVIDTEKAMAEPAPQVEPLEPVSGGLHYVVRVWVKTEDYWDVYHELMREIPTALGAADIPGPASSITIRS